MAWDTTKITDDVILSTDWNAMVTDQKTRLTDITGEVINDLSDVVITTPADNDILSYDTGSGNHINQTLGSLGDGMTFALGTPTDGDITDGLEAFTTATLVTDAIDAMNETLSFLAPANADSMNGDTLTTSGVTFYTGRLSSGNTNYKGGDAAGSTVSYITNDGDFTVVSPNQSTTFNYADEGNLKYYLNTVLTDTVDLATNFVEGERVGTQTGTPWVGAASDLSVTSVAYYNSFPKWQLGNASVTIVSADLQQGYNAIYLLRDGMSSSVDQTSATLDVFYDNDIGSDPSVNTPTVAENTTSFRYLSGVKMYDRTSTFDLDVTGSDCFDNVYHQTSPLTHSTTNGTITSGNIDFDDASVSGVSATPVIGETMTVTNKLITVPSSNVRSTNARVSVTPRDPYASYSAGTSASANRLIDAYATTSTATSEFLDDENRRLPDNDGNAYPDNYDSIPGTITAQWTSSTALSNGEAQVYNGSLFFPTINFSTGYLPTNTVNYSAFSGNQYYLRAMFDSGGTPHSSGQLEFANLTNSDVGAVGAGNINIEIKLPTQTGWLDLGTAFDSGTFTGADGDGCRTAQSGDDWSWSAGTFSTANSGDMIIVRVTFRNSTDSITQIRELGW